MPINTQLNPRPEEFNQNAEYTIFVEGKEDSFDPIVFKKLFEKNSINIEVKPLGPCSSIRNVAQALYPHHPKYYFIVDRDHYDDSQVEYSWENFPDPETNNLLIWRKRELENYFLDLDYLTKSEHFKGNHQELKTLLLTKASERLYLEVANAVIIDIREKFKKTWIQKFNTINGFSSKNDALHKLTSIAEFEQHSEEFRQNIDSNNLVEKFEEILADFTGNNERLNFESGSWLNKMGGKELLNSLISSQYFKVIDNQERIVQGKVAIERIVKGLLSLPLNQQPNDFQHLCELVKER